VNGNDYRRSICDTADGSSCKIGIKRQRRDDGRREEDVEWIGG
jgi:hypothetical protein